MTTNQKTPPKRGRFSEAFFKNLTAGKNSEILKALRTDDSLDIQLRDNYINVYFRGGNLLCIYPQSYQFDKYFFYRRNTGSKPFPKTYVEKISKGKRNEIPKGTTEPIPTETEAKHIIDQLDIKVGQLKELISSEITEYISQAKQIMNEWFEEWPKKERNDQHYIALSNKVFNENSDLVVVDIEFAVSPRHIYNNLLKSNGEKKECRFDIVAIDKSGQLYVIELKENHNANAKENKANVEIHHHDFNNTIGSDADGIFLKEISNLVNVKQKLGILDEKIEVDLTKQPIFAVAYSGENGADAFNQKYARDGIKVIRVIRKENNGTKRLYLRF